DVIIGQAYDQLVKYNWTDDERALYEWIEKNENDNVSCLNQKFYEGKKEGIQIGEERGREEGIQIGHQKGRAEGRKERDIEVAKNSLKAGVSIDVIVEITGLSVDEVKQLQEEIAL
ncbi:MAG: Rpn family recombination-promoting nuclease/putative transposase, partial [Wolbachia sp.]